MKKLTEYLLESFDRYFKLSDEDKSTLLKLDDEYHRLMELFSFEQVHYTNVTNTQDEIKRILKNVKDNKDFELNIKYEKSKFEDEKWCK